MPEEKTEKRNVNEDVTKGQRKRGKEKKIEKLQKEIKAFGEKNELVF